jgi:O-6-methylguanine DNA methyltransferase
VIASRVSASPSRLLAITSAKAMNPQYRPALFHAGRFGGRLCSRMYASRQSPPDRAFKARVLAAVRRIPAGRVATYGDVATLAGAPGAARAVGTVLKGCQDGATPCHRVIGASGVLGGWSGPLEGKRARLRHEGVQVDLVRVQEFARIRWTPRGHGIPAARNRRPARRAR